MECGKFMGYAIYQNEHGYYWAHGGYYDDIAECKDEIAAYYPFETPYDSPSLAAPWGEP
jgi:hypothetical protein